MSQAFSGLLPLENIPDYRAQICALMELCAPYSDGEITLDQVMEEIEDGRMPLVCAISNSGKMENALAIQVMQYANQRALVLVCGAGRNMKQHLPTAIEIARALDCKVIETRTRPNVARLFQREKFYPSHVIMRFRDF